MSKGKTTADTATAVLSCSEGCIEIEYQATHKAPDVDAKDFLNELGPPQGMILGDDGKSVCPGCDGGLTVDWGDDDV